MIAKPQTLEEGLHNGTGVEEDSGTTLTMGPRIERPSRAGAGFTAEALPDNCASHR